jgi:oxygen-dependent protoporphyrinogen oxidase
MGADRPRVAVVGGGITGLATAYRLVRSLGSGIDVMVFEADHRLGGKVRTVEVGGVRVESGADSFVVRKPWAVDLCTELGLDDELVVPAASGAFVRTQDGLHPFPPRSAFGIPSKAGDLLRWRGLGRPARLRALLDLYRPSRRSDADEALGRLLRRRLGERAARVMVEPLLAGLHAADPERLSTLATFPEIFAWERVHGSLIRGSASAIKASAESGAGPMFATVWGGLDRLVDALASYLGPGRLRVGTRVLAMEGEDRVYRLRTEDGDHEANAVVLASPAFEAARLLARVNGDAASSLETIPYISTAVVILVYPEGTGHGLPEGTGFVTPTGSGVVTACTWISRKWPSEELGTRAVIRCFVGRAGSEEALDLEDGRLIEAVRLEFEAAVPMPSPPDASGVVRWLRAMPQYEVGHLDRVEGIERALDVTPGIFVAGSAYRGVGIPDCIRQAGEAAERVRGHLDGAGHGNGQAAGDETEREAIGWTT